MTRVVSGGRDLRAWRLPRCSRCGLPAGLCVCAELPKLAVGTRLVVVMHRLEALRSSNTGRLAVAMLSNASLRIRGERDAPVEAPPAGRRLVLFPVEGARELSPKDLNNDVGLTLVVPDGTWSQARRIHRRDPAARGAESVTLPGSVHSEYALRRNAREGGLCTLEAIAAAFDVLEGAAVAAALRGAFTLWHERAQRARHGERSSRAPHRSDNAW